ncbi:MAG: hypothetical protein ACI9CF_001596 [Candidatus Omnitrophota bacterium]|jgi:hypothetical protein
MNSTRKAIIMVTLDMPPQTILTNIREQVFSRPLGQRVGSVTLSCFLMGIDQKIRENNENQV